MREIVAGAPEASVDEHRRRKRTVAFGYAEVGEMVFVAAITEANVCRRRSVGEDVLACLHGAQQNISSD
jgi:hypothetical protein